MDAQSGRVIGPDFYRQHIRNLHHRKILTTQSWQTAGRSIIVFNVRKERAAKLMWRKIRTAISVFRAHGSLGVMFVLLRNIWGVEVVLNEPGLTDGEINSTRRKMSEYLADLHKNTVAYGPFKGLILPDKNWWGQLDVAAQILGCYERQVQEKIAELANPDAIFVDIGSADGYFAIGAVKAGLFRRAICFEISEMGREVLSNNAVNNSVADQITILEEANLKSIATSIRDFSAGVLLCDIEGGEFRLLSRNFLKQTRHLHQLVELHPRHVEDGMKQRADLVSRASEYFDVALLRASDIRISEFKELRHFNDNERLLSFSEGRGAAGEWMQLTPKDVDISN